MKYKVVETHTFKKWLLRLKDKQAEKRVRVELNKIALGNFGDCKQLSDYRGLYEKRLDFGPGYRLYYTKERHIIIVMLLGGDKSTQKRDICRAWELKRARKKI